MWGKTKTFKIVYYDHNVKSGDTRRSTFVEAYDRLGKAEEIYKKMNDNPDTYISECEENYALQVKNAVSEISSTSANANSTAMQQMQEQIKLAKIKILYFFSLNTFK